MHRFLLSMTLKSATRYHFHFMIYLFGCISSHNDIFTVSKIDEHYSRPDEIIQLKMYLSANILGVVQPSILAFKFENPFIAFLCDTLSVKANDLANTRVLKGLCSRFYGSGKVDQWLR